MLRAITLERSRFREISISHWLCVLVRSVIEWSVPLRYRSRGLKSFEKKQHMAAMLNFSWWDNHKVSYTYILKVRENVLVEQASYVQLPGN